MTVYSYSRVNTYFTCPAQFDFRYQKKIPSPVAEGVELFMGSRFHETMEFLYQQLPRRVPTVNEIVGQFDAGWESHWKAALQKQKEKNYADPLRVVHEGQTVEDYFQKGRLFVENYYHKYQPFDQDDTEGIELKVAFNLDGKGEYKMQGYLDRLSRDAEGTLWIHDYKTSSRKLSEEDARNEDQLALYQIGLQQNAKYASEKKVKLAWHFVAFEKDIVVSERNPKEIEWLKKKYVSKIQTIEKSKSFPAKTGPLCRWCEYLTLCPEGKEWAGNREKKIEAKTAREKSPAASAVFSPSVPAEIPEVSIPASSPDLPQVPLSRKKKSKLLSVSTDQLPLF